MEKWLLFHLREVKQWTKKNEDLWKCSVHTVENGCLLSAAFSLSLIIIIISMPLHAYISIIPSCICVTLNDTNAHLISFFPGKKASSSLFIYVIYILPLWHAQCLVNAKHDIITDCMKLKNNNDSNSKGNWQQRKAEEERRKIAPPSDGLVFIWATTTVTQQQHIT